MRLLLTRALIAAVTLINFQCATAFILAPSRYAPGFGLTGMIGVSVVRGIGVLFLMWTVPYWVALWNPIRFRIALFEAAVMQTIGLVGEVFIYQSLQSVNGIGRPVIARFIFFDAAGLILLLTAVCLSIAARTSSLAAPG